MAHVKGHDELDEVVSTGGGAAAGALAGAVAGSVAGPLGAAVGAAVGAVAGGTAGAAAGKIMDPTVEDNYWKGYFTDNPGNYKAGYTYDDYGPAYRLGYTARQKYHDRDFDTLDNELRSEWEQLKAKSRLEYEEVKAAARAAWNRIV